MYEVIYITAGGLILVFWRESLYLLNMAKVWGEFILNVVLM